MYLITTYTPNLSVDSVMFITALSRPLQGWTRANLYLVAMSLASFNREHFLSPLFFMTLTFLKNSFPSFFLKNIYHFGLTLYFLMIRFRLYILGRNIMQVILCLRVLHREARDPHLSLIDDTSFDHLDKVLSYFFTCN